MPVSDEGYVTGSVDVSKLDDIDPSSDEAKAQVEALKQRRDEGQAQADADAARIAEAAAAQDNTEPVEDNRDVQGKPQADGESSDEEKPAEEKKQDAPQAQPASQPAQPAEQKPAKKSSTFGAPENKG